MASLLQKLGMPPYRMDQIVSLLDEASALSSNPKTTSTQHRDNAVQIAETLEALASRVNTSLREVLPQFVVKPDPAAAKRHGPYIEDVHVPPFERDVLDQLGPKALELKDWLFDNFQQSSQTSRPVLDTAQLCQYCSWPFKRLARRRPNGIGPLPDLFETPHFLLTIDDWPTFDVLEKRALQGCDLCLFLREHLCSLAERRPEIFDAEPVHVWIGFLWDRPWTDSMFLESMMVFLTSRRNFVRALYFTIDTTHDNIAKELGIGAPASISLDSANVDFIKRQIVSTEKNIETTSCYRPKRLVDLGFSTQFEPKLIHGQQAEVTSAGLRYATLSYCWGEVGDSKNQLKLTTDTQQRFYRSIPFGSMTPVLRDAVTVCRALEVRYLWIDSLCIQQDGDSTDWEEQSQEMSHIFGNSWLTICAPASKSCLEGFLDHTDRHSPAIHIEYAPEESGQVHGSLSLRLFTHNGEPALQDGALVSTRTALFRDLKYSKWSTRGWVFQERILSPRLLYFGARMVHFQHGYHVVSEDGTFFDGDFIDLNMIRPCPTNLLHQLEMIQKKGPFITDYWYKLVTAINPPNFTDRRDTFPAIAGIARRVHEFTGQRYVAGLWEEDLCCGLVWTPQLKYQGPPASLRQVLQIIKKSTRTIAPSWSWASRRSSVTFIVTDPPSITCRVRSHLRAESKILESHVTVDGVNPYGRIKNASISLSGRTIKLAPDALGLMQMVAPQLQLCELFPNLFVFVRTDWSSMRYWEHTGIKKKMRAHFQLLLMASCCSDRRISAHKRAGAAHAEPNVRSGITKTRKEMADKYNEGLKPEYRTTFHEDSHPGFDAAVDCDVCSDHTLRRDIWGLLIYPVGPLNTYYRVGIFSSRAEHGGSAIFEGVEHRSIELI